MRLSENIFDLRRKAGMSQEELADAVGVSRQAVGKWENGTSVPELDKLLALAEAFNVTVEELLGLERPGSGERDGGDVGELLKSYAQEQREALARYEEALRGLERVSRRQRLHTWLALGGAGVLAVALIVGMSVRFANLNDRVNGVTDKLNRVQSSLSGELMDLQGSIRDILTEQDKIFYRWEARVLGFDPEAMTLTQRITALPKSIADGSTASVVLTGEDGTRYEARTRVDGQQIVAEADVPEGFYDVTASLTSDGVTSQEDLGTFRCSFDDLAADIRAAWLCGPKWETEDDSLTASGMAVLLVPEDMEITRASAQIIRAREAGGPEGATEQVYPDGSAWGMADGQVIGSADIPVTVDRWYDSFALPEEYRKANPSFGGAGYGADITQTSPSVVSREGYRVLTAELDFGTIQAGQDESLLLELRLQAKGGLAYRVLLYKVRFDMPSAVAEVIGTACVDREAMGID